MAWLKFKDGISADQIDRHLMACRSLPQRIPAVISLECGANFTERAAGFTHGIIVSVSGRAALSEYLKHPAHVPVAEALKADLADLRVMDIEW
jgi:hypothetical protein